MSSGLGNVTNASVRDSIGDRCFNAGHIAIDGTNTENVETTVAIEHCVNGVFQTDFAIASEINVSALTVISGDDGSTLDATSIHAAKASGDDDETIVLLLACKGNIAYVIEQYIDVAAAQDDANYELTCPSGFAVFAAIKLVRTAADTAAFQFGNDTGATGDLDETGRTATFFDISVLPPTVALLATV